MIRFHGAVASLAIVFIGEALAVIATIILARWLGVQNFGIYSFAISAVTVLALPVTLGIPKLLLRETAKFQAKGEWQYLKGAMKLAGTAVTIGAVIVLLVGFATFSPIAGSNQAQASALLVALLLVPILGLSEIRAAFVSGLGHPLTGQLVDRIIRPSLLLLALLLAVLYAEPTASFAVTLQVATSFIAMLVGILLALKLTPAALRDAKPAFKVREWGKSVVPFTLISASLVISTRVDILMLGWLGGMNEVGLYRVSSQGATLVTVAQTAIVSYIAPSLVRSHHANELANVRNLVRYAGMFSTAIGATALLTILVLGPLAIDVLFGADYAGAFPALVILAGGLCIGATFGPVGLLLSTHGLEKYTLATIACATLGNVILNALMIPSWGAIGAAFASSICFVSWNFVLWRVAITRTKINTFSLAGCATKIGL